LPLILYNESTVIRGNLHHFRKRRNHPTVLTEVERDDTIMAPVRSGLGATILPQCS
jgi:DNA-binding transcriptional LysR family regulator